MVIAQLYLTLKWNVQQNVSIKQLINFYKFDYIVYLKIPRFKRRRHVYIYTNRWTKQHNNNLIRLNTHNSISMNLLLDFLALNSTSQIFREF